MQNVWDDFCRIAGTDAPYLTGAELSQVIRQRGLEYAQVTDAVLAELYEARVRPVVAHGTVPTPKPVR